MSPKSIQKLLIFDDAMKTSTCRHHYFVPSQPPISIQDCRHGAQHPAVVSLRWSHYLQAGFVRNPDLFGGKCTTEV